MKTVKKYSITLLIGFLLVGAIILLRDIFSQTEASAVFHILCDAFFATGVVLTSAGLLVFSANEGTFDMIVYGLKSFFNLFRKQSTLKHATFYDYRVAREGQKIKFWYIVFCGLFFLAVSAVMYLLYCKYL